MEELVDQIESIIWRWVAVRGWGITKIRTLEQGETKNVTARGVKLAAAEIAALLRPEVNAARALEEPGD